MNLPFFRYLSIRNFQFLIAVTMLNVTVLLIGCKEEIKPSIPEEKMVKILADLHVSEAAIMSLNHKVKDSVSQLYYSQVFEIHEVTDSVFYKDLEILRKDPRKVEKMYEKVVAEIEQLGVEKTKEQLPLKKK